MDHGTLPADLHSNKLRLKQFAKIIKKRGRTNLHSNKLRLKHIIHQTLIRYNRNLHSNKLRLKQGHTGNSGEYA